MTTTVEPVDWVAANQSFLTAALAVLRQRVLGEPVEAAVRRRDALQHSMPAPALHAMAAAFGLSDFERDALLLCAGVELDTGLARACATAHDDPSRPYATLSLALARLPDPHWSALAPAAPLRRWHLLELSRPEQPTTSPARADERVLHALTGVSYLDSRIEPLAEPAPEPGPLPPSLQAMAERLAGYLRGGTRRAQLHGRAPPDLRAAAAAACAALGLQAVCLRAADLPTAPADRELLARLCERETALEGRAWIVEVDDAAGDASRAALRFAAQIKAPLVLVSREPLGGAPGKLTRFTVAAPPLGEVRATWARALGDRSDALGPWLDRLAGQFDLDLAAMGSAVAEAGPGRPGDDADGDAGTRLWAACREQARPALDDLAQRIDTRADWEDLVLPAPQARTLRQIESQVRHRLTVLHEWGFAERGGRGLGVAALFAGPSGTGKTLAAEVLAGRLELDLYRVDLSQVVSKYIGETEKNLRRIFDAAEAGGAVLLFDEADALFGKRSEVKDSHDRYANIEVSYLLQRMETYRGLAILTTNLKTSLDSAFLRRLRFIVQFPFPDATGRAEIWRRTFPERTPTDGLDPEKLARLSVAGGTIRNIALCAAFLAAGAGEPVRMTHLLRAARTEYAKLERPLTDAEVAGWTR